MHDNTSSVLNKLVVVKVNGSLGTGVVCKGSKSMADVENDNAFLHLAVQQIELWMEA